MNQDVMMSGEVKQIYPEAHTSEHSDIVSTLRLQADLIATELRILQYAVAACETHGLSETARQMRLSIDVLRGTETILRGEAQSIEEPTL